MQTEIWRPVTRYEGVYVVSNLGQVKSVYHHKSRIMGTTLRSGYPSVHLTTKDGKEHHHRVHRLLAEAFIPNPEKKPQVDHVDGNKLNFSLNNLRWAFPGENSRYARDSRLWLEAIDLIKHSEPSVDSNLLRKLTEDFRIKKQMIPQLRLVA